MGGTMAFGWLGGLFVLASRCRRGGAARKEPGGSESSVRLMVFAAIGGVALVGVVAVALMHGGMSWCG